MTRVILGACNYTLESFTRRTNYSCRLLFSLVEKGHGCAR